MAHFSRNVCVCHEQKYSSLERLGKKFENLPGGPFHEVRKIVPKSNKPKIKNFRILRFGGDINIVNWKLQIRQLVVMA